MKRIYLVMLALLLASTMHAQTSPEEWTLKAENFVDQKYYGVTTANGMIGLISSPEPFKVGETVLAGVYDYFGRGRVLNFLPNISPLNLEVKLGGTKLNKRNVSSYSQTVDMKNGEFVGEMDFNGSHVVYRYCALRNLSHAVMMEVKVVPGSDLLLEATLKHEVPSSLHDARMTTNDLSFHHKSEPPFTIITTTAMSPTDMVKTASSSIFLFPKDDASLPVQHKINDSNMHYIAFRKELKAGEEYTFHVIGSLISSEHTADPLNQAERIVTYARFQKKGELIRKHRAAWAKLWESDIIIEGDLQAQKEVRSMLYHLYSFSREGIAQSLSPMGLSGLGYNGHVFWDTEMFMLPPVLMLQPQMARSMLEYRFERLDEARRNASAYGFAGAMFPWESASTGAEECPVTSLSGTFQHHVTADVAIAAWNYWLVTQDREWLESRGWPLLKATAEFWTSRVEKGEDGRYHINNVMCADEWALNKDDNAYTNGAAKRNLEFASKAASVLGMTCPDEWLEIADGLFFGKMPDGVTSEHAGYDGADIKQADVNLLAYPLKLITDRKQCLRDLEYYSAKVPQQKTPAMTQSMFSVICSRCGETEEAYRWFIDSYRPNQNPPFGVLAEFKGGTNPYFATGAGGTLQAVIMGFAGLDFNPDGGIMQVKPHGLPSHWKKLVIKGVGPEKRTFEVVNKR